MKFKEVSERYFEVTLGCSYRTLYGHEANIRTLVLKYEKDILDLVEDETCIDEIYDYCFSSEADFEGDISSIIFYYNPQSKAERFILEKICGYFEMDFDDKVDTTIKFSCI